MTCGDIQQTLLRGYDLDAMATAHLSRCAACAAVEEKLLALHRAVRGLPAPADSAAARDRFLARLAAAPQPAAVRRQAVVLRIARSRWAVAAVVALAVGGGTWAYLEHRGPAESKTIAGKQSPISVDPNGAIVKEIPSRGASEKPMLTVLPRQAPLASNAPISVPGENVPTPVSPDPLAASVNEVLGRADEDLLAQLVSHNVELSEIPSPDQRRSAFKGAAALRQKARVAKLSPGARKVADALLSDSEWLAEHDDPLATADRFGEVADLLVDRMNMPGASPDALTQLGQSYYLVLDRGISQNLDRAGAGTNLTADRQKKLARSLQNHERLQHRLETLMEKYPNATRQQVVKAIEAARQQHRKKLQGQPATPAAKP